MTKPNDLAELVSNLTSVSKSLADRDSDAATISSIGTLAKALTNVTSSIASDSRSASNGQSWDNLLAQLVQVAATGKEQSETLRNNTNAVEASSGKSIANSSSLDVFKGLASVLSGGILPLVSGLFSAFSGSSDTSQQNPIVKFALPSSVSAEAGLTNSGNVTLIDRNENGNVRPVNAGTHITVQVQALDSRSFMDRSDDIARAVRDAMLHSSSLNDVIQDI